MKLLARIFGKAMLKKYFLFNSTWEIPLKKNPDISSSVHQFAFSYTQIN